MSIDLFVSSKKRDQFQSSSLSRNMQSLSGETFKKSPHLGDYNQFLQQVAFFYPEQLLNSASQKLSVNKIVYRKQVFIPKVTVAVASSSSNWTVVNLLVSISYFTFEITAFNFDGSNNLKKGLLRIGEGGMGNVYLSLNSMNQKVSIKSIFYQSGSIEGLKPKSIGQPSRNSQRNLRQIIKQYCITKLMSVLELGPIIQDFGFDILISEEEVFFAMEVCSPITVLDQVWKIESKRCLKLLHFLKIVHGDIKQENVMWSNKLKKAVLIDYGLARIVKEQLSFETFTHYFGTYYHCLPEMKLLFKQKSFGYVDLFFNDVYCLKGLKTSQRSIDYFKAQDCFIDNKARLSVEFLDNIKLQSLILKSSIAQVASFCYQNKTLSICPFILAFFEQLQPNKKYVQILSDLETRFALNSNHIKVLMKYHSGRQLTINRKRVVINRFQRRIKQEIQGQIGTSATMLILLLYFFEDVTPRANFKKRELYKTIKEAKLFDFSFWKSVVQYISNLFTEDEEIVDMLLYLGTIVLKINCFPCEPRNYFEIYEAATLVTLEVRKVFGFRLQQILEGLHQQRIQSIQRQFAQEIRQNKQFLQDWFLNLKIFENYTELRRASKLIRRTDYLKNAQLSLRYPQSLIVGFHSLAIQSLRYSVTSKSIAVQIFLKQNQIYLQSTTNLENLTCHYIKMQRFTINQCFDTSKYLQYYLMCNLQAIISNDPLLIENLEISFKKLELFLSDFSSEHNFFMLSYYLNKILSRAQFHVAQLKSLFAIMQKLNSFYHQQLKKAVSLKLITSGEDLIEIYTIFLLLSNYLSLDSVKEDLDSVQNYTRKCLKLKDSDMLYEVIRIKTKCLVKLKALSFKEARQIILQSVSIKKVESHMSYLSILLQGLHLSNYAEEDGTFFADKIQQAINQKDISFIPIFLNSIEIYIYLTTFYGLDILQRFERGFGFLLRMLCQCSHPKIVNSHNFVIYIFLRTFAWPYLNTVNFSTGCKLFVESIQSEMMKESVDIFYLKYSDVLGIIEMLICFIYTYKLEEKMQKEYSFLIRTALYCSVSANSFIRRMFCNKIYTIYCSLPKVKLCCMKKRKLILKQFRTNQYPVRGHKLDELLFSWKKIRLQSSRKGAKRIKEKLMNWNLNKENSSINLKQCDLGYQFVLLLCELVGQNFLEQCVIRKELNVGHQIQRKCMPKFSSKSKSYIKTPIQNINE